MPGRGFTLIELIIVAAIIIVLVALSNPLFKRTFRDTEIANSVYELAKIIEYGQRRAVIEEKKYRLIIDADKGIYFLATENNGGEKPAGGEDGERGPLWNPAGGRFGGGYTLPRGVNLTGIEKDIIFFPSGRSDKVTISVEEDGKGVYRIVSSGRAGYVRVEEIQAD